MNIDRIISIGKQHVHNDEELRILKHFNIVLLFMAVMVILSLSTNIYIGRWRMHDSIFYFGAALLTMSCFSLNKAGHLLSSKILFFLSAVMIIFFEAIYSGHIFMNAMIYIALLLMGARFFIKTNIVIAGGFVIWISMLLSILVISKSEYDFSPLEYDHPVLQAMSFTFVFFGTFFMVYFIIKDLRLVEASKASLITELNQQNILLEHTNKTVEEFAFRAAHDIRSPLRSINAYSEIIKQKLTKQNYKDLTDYMQVIEDSSKELMLVLDQMLDDSRNKGSETEDLSNVPFQSLINQLSKEFEVLYPKAQIVMKGKPSIHADRTALRSIFQNLIENGLKYNTTENPSVIISYTDLGPDHKFFISDNGIGISSQDTEAIFSPFYKGRNTESESGYGVGLSNCKTLVENKLKGKLQLRESSETGSIFELSIPKKQ